MDRLIDNNAASITQYARNDPPVNIANFGDKLDCRYVFSRNREYSFKKYNLKNQPYKVKDFWVIIISIFYYIYFFKL